MSAVSTASRLAISSWFGADYWAMARVQLAVAAPGQGDYPRNAMP